MNELEMITMGRRRSIAIVLVAVVGMSALAVLYSVKEGRLTDVSKYPLERDPLPLPSPPVEEAVRSGRFIVTGTISQSKPRLGYEPAAAVEVGEWITDAPPQVKRALSKVEDGHCLRAYIPGRAWGHPFPPGVVGSRYIVVVELAPAVLMLGDNTRVENAGCQLVAAYPASSELLERVRALAAQIATSQRSGPGEP